MKEPKKAYVNIYCKIYTENFSDEMIDREASGQEIYDFLMKDAGLCFDREDRSISGDSNLWYLGCNEKFGNLVYNDQSWNWGFGESSFDNVENYVRAIYEDGLFTEEQYSNLMSRIEEGRRIGDMYLICEHLVANNITAAKRK